MTRTSAEDFTHLAAAIDDPRVRAHFTHEFMVAAEVYNDLVDAASWRILGEVGAMPPPEGATPAETLARNGYPTRCLPVLTYLYEKVALAGALVRDGDRFRPAGGWELGTVEELERELVAVSPSAAIGAELVRVVVTNAPAYFSGQKTGEDILFSLDKLPLWFRFFSNDDILYSVNNALGAEALARVLPESGAEILEIGGGAGSAAEVALRQLGPRVARYHFTEVVPTFARRGERAARAAAAPGTCVTAGRVDMDRDWEEQGVAPGSFDAVYSVNCFHVSRDLDAVLARAERALKPGGSVIVSECVKPTGQRLPIYVELVFSFLESFTNVTTATRPTYGFLSPAEWREAFARAGLPKVEVIPDVDALARLYPRFYAGAIVARREPAHEAAP